MEKKYNKLVKESRKAIDKGFYATKIPHKKYGAAVLTKKGNIYSAGQYSSYNHITSIHAEMAAIILATMNNDPEICALSLSCSDNNETFSCGICLQFIKEHSMRTGNDIYIIYDYGDRKRCFFQSEITNEMW
ncbi:cytidine deaminase [Intestinibacter bartlettii]|uniref:cytidine deaminase n=1 Tax=Intestinibacter bartlettii TaxID=261299 RepID=UPI0022E33360|nr:cytidine deaminase [Intestinibacter bartlettii]